MVLFKILYCFILNLKKNRKYFLRFDDKKNNVGTLTTKLAVEASAVQGVRI
jgi:hypothetical protein